ncbi:MAG: Histidinol-phosphatase [Candidatus Magnetoglobus multicellularis str. Araruama]|uniref:Histidinol-phosphatase n=1 Tax=Candidatus Magnetoglobus multicellularis str. Araruama TaxID=890399 RepID=A0A1V1PDJ3_9BACT|nr:MAG: Histidinol-phosphatase [Candidatus Magnetoglobus multicellularis str. Araruama]
MNIAKVSIHGGHSGEFCFHAKDTLETIVKAYIQKGFQWVGITEHIPPPNDALRYPDEIDANLDYDYLTHQFSKYMIKARALQKKYQDDIRLFIGFESEAYSGYMAHVKSLIDEYQPDYVVGSVHHVDDINFDYSPELYQQAIDHAGGIIPLYERYFDIQFEMIQKISPKVIGHFDVIRLYDPLYRKHMAAPTIAKRIHRNLSLICSKQLILDFNLRALIKGADEPYITFSILEKAQKMGIAIVPGDDSHSLDTVGLNIEKGIDLLQEFKGHTHWQLPAEI